MNKEKKETKTLQEKILKLKKESNASLLVHNYQVSEIQDIGDYIGDSLGLAKISKELKSEIIVLCGVKFMAETVKILSPEKKVLLPVREAGCPLADMISHDELIELKKIHPDAWVVSYVNTSAEIKALSDVCCTSANAVEVVRNVPVKKVIFIPDRNLGEWVKMNVPEKEIILWQGFCVVHEYFSLKDLEYARKLHPDARILVHPECRKEILEASDSVLSTSGILKEANTSKVNKFIIGTEEGIIHRLKKENPKKEFYSLGNAKICINMKKITLKDVHDSLLEKKYDIEVEKEIRDNARQALERMVSYV